MTAALLAEGLHTYGISLEAAEGKVTALLDRNGAGKTTTLHLAIGIPSPSETSIERTQANGFQAAAKGASTNHLFMPE